MVTYCAENDTYQIDGFVTAPHPKIDFGTERKTVNALKRHEQWLIEQAYARCVSWRRNEHCDLWTGNSRQVSETTGHCNRSVPISRI